MSLAPGTRIGVYEIRDSLGAGGMGEVYRARDTRLNRDVAIKVLPEALAGDPERLARLHREAQVLASLNHPNIAIVHGFEESRSVRALVMELVDGPTLADRLMSGPLDLDEAIPIARQIIVALDAAHEQGVVHRDLKASNIKLRPDGTVKVLDFGLAKIASPRHPRLSPDGKRLARVSSGELWEYDLTGRPPVRLTTEGTVFSPLWTPDGRSLVYESGNATSLRVVEASARATLRPASPDGHFHPHGWSPDGKELLAVQLTGNETSADIVRFSPDSIRVRVNRRTLKWPRTGVSWSSNPLCAARRRSRSSATGRKTFHHAKAIPCFSNSTI